MVKANESLVSNSDSASGKSNLDNYSFAEISTRQGHHPSLTEAPMELCAS